MKRKLPYARARRRQRQEGVVLLVVLMMLMMATGTAVYAMQSTSYEQKASTSLLEASISRAASECMTMGGISLEQENMVTRGGVVASWTASAPAGTSYPVKYSLQVPSDANTATPALPAVNASFPAGSDGFLCGTNARNVNGNLLHEPKGYLDTNGKSRLLITISGFGELYVSNNDPVDSNGVRRIHEVVSTTRAYFDMPN